MLNYLSIYMLGRLLAVFSSLILLPLFTKKIPQEEFGIVGILWLAGPILTRLINIGVDVSVSLKFYKLTNKELSNYLYNALLIVLSLASTFWLIFYFNMDIVHWALDPSLSPQYFSLFIFSITTSVLLGIMRSFLQLGGKAWWNVFYTVLPPIVISAVTYYLIIYVEPSYSSYIIGMAVGNGVFGGVALLFFFKNYSIKFFRLSIRIIKNLVKVGIPVLPGTLAVLILAAGDRYIIKYFMGLEAVALYTYGYRFSEYVLISIFQPFQKSIVPIILKKAAGNFEEAAVYSQRLTGRALGYITIIVGAVIIPFKDIMNYLSVDAYSLSYTIFLISIFGILLNNISNIYSIIFNHLERTDLNMVLGILCALLNVGLNIWLIPIYGVVAAALTTVVSFMVVLILSIFLLNRFTRQKISVSRVFIATLPFLLYLSIIYIIDTGSIINPIQTFQIYALKIIAFIGFLLLSFSMSKELRNDFYKIVNKKT